MMDKPSLLEIVGAAKAFVDEKAIPELQGHVAFHARVAVNALALGHRRVSDRMSSSRAR